VEVLPPAKLFKEWYLEENLKVRIKKTLSDEFCIDSGFPLGIVKKITRGKVAVFTCALDISQTETKGTVLIRNADEMLNFTTGEEKQLEKVPVP
jgi:hypothetical protein